MDVEEKQVDDRNGKARADGEDGGWNKSSKDQAPVVAMNNASER